MKQHWLDKMDGLIIEGDVLDGLALLEDESVETIVTDPPYDLLQGSRKGSGRSNNPDSPAGRHGTKTGGFMGMAWDATGVAFNPKTWEACLRVLKPGGHMVVFGGTRTHHRMWCAIEDAGFEVREMLLWLHGQGFPKSYNVGQAVEKLRTTGKARRPDRDLGVGRRYDHAGDSYPDEVRNTGGQVELTTEEAQQWEGWGTALKPACEPILLARKPLTEKNVAANVLKFGTGALNIDATRIGNEIITTHSRGKNSAFPKRPGETTVEESGRTARQDQIDPTPRTGRWPANVMLDEEAAAQLDAQSGESKSSGKINRWKGGAKPFGGAAGLPYESVPGHEDFGGASRFFYRAKVSKKERGEGNNHPTVKPIALMRWFVRLVTPPNGVVLDPFCGSGSTLIAATKEGFGFIGIDFSPEYCGIALRRLKGKGRKS
jgi:site-specific DNA-methyltransferase (adenine-specific)